MTEAKLKTCSKCGHPKAATTDNFYARNNRKGSKRYLNGKCIDCCNKSRRVRSAVIAPLPSAGTVDPLKAKEQVRGVKSDEAHESKELFLKRSAAAKRAVATRRARQESGERPGNVERKGEPVLPVDVPDEDAAAPSDDDQKIKDLVRLTRKGPVTLMDLCNELETYPGDIKRLVELASARHIRIEIADGRVGLPPSAVRDDTQILDVSPVLPGMHQVGVISDTHLGSKYCLRSYLREAVQAMYDQGVRVILHPGDVLDGCYHHGKWELSHHGLEDQVTDLFETLPHLPGLTYHFITGNHDETFWKDTGANVGAYMQNYFEMRGRKDLIFHGDRGAFLRYQGCAFHLWHPMTSAGYAVSYGLQKKVESYSPGMKPNVLLVGHWHQQCYVRVRGVDAIACPTFQGSGSRYSASLRGGVSIGALRLQWELTADGTIRTMNLQPRFYFELETPQVISP